MSELETLWTTLNSDNLKSSQSMLKQFLTQDVYDKLKSRKTEGGTSLANCIKSGVDNPNSGIGVYASDTDAYTKFAELFNPIIAKYHGIPTTKIDSFEHPKQNFNFDNKYADNLDPTGKFVVSTRVRVARNIKGYPLRPAMNKEQVLDLENKVKEILESLDGDLKGTYYPLKGMDNETQKKLIEDHFLFKEGDKYLASAGINQFWPEGRGIFHNKDKTFLVWVNEEDQLRIISMEQGGNIKSIFNRLQKAVDAIGKKLEFAYDKKFGYVSSCPTNLGSGERASVHVKIPLVSANEKLFKDICDKYNVQARGINGEHSESAGGVYDISNRRRLGITEWDGVEDLINGTKALIEAETQLQNEKGVADIKI